MVAEQSAVQDVGAHVVIDSNIALDLLVFADPTTTALGVALDGGQVRWIATASMRAELARVLDYPKLAPRVAFHGLTRDAVLARFDALAQLLPEAPRAPVRCHDPDDQVFVDLAWSRQARLLSKDHHLLRLKKRLHPWGVAVARHWDEPSLPDRNN